MKVSEQWLREWVNPAIPREKLADTLTLAGLEVDACVPVAGAFTGVVIGRVLTTKPHPQADRLTLCTVDAGTGTLLAIVCGASNVRPNLTVALAMIGACLPGDFVIKAAKLRGELSQGMLCSASELGLEAAAEGILELPDDAPIGMDFRAYMALDDYIFDIDLTPNRGDCLSVLGVARDLAVLTDEPCPSIPAISITKQTNDMRNVHLDTPRVCPRYSGRIVRDINPNAVTPLWMRERLRRGGVRAIHPVVDSLNYVMLELGQPMHAFDLSALSGDLHVRYAYPDESLQLLNQQDIRLDDHTVVIADAEKALAIAGVMGGAASAVNADTTDIFIESAFFIPYALAGVARRYGLCTDSSQRYERGVDPELSMVALERATECLLSIVGGKPGPITVSEEFAYLPVSPIIFFDPARVAQLTGLVVSEKRMHASLTALGMEVVTEKSHWRVVPPSYRFDITCDVDLVEEIARIYGYDNMNGRAQSISMDVGNISPMEETRAWITHWFAHRGYAETISYSFVDPELQATLYPNRPALTLVNPISSELSVMRLGLWPGLIASMLHNMHRQQTAIRLFETGVVFEHTDTGTLEHPCVAALLAGELGNLNWSEEKRFYDFFDLKGDLESLLGPLKRPIRFIAAEHPALHPGKSAQIYYDGVSLGWIGALHPRLLDALDINCDVILCELSLRLLVDGVSIAYQKISKYPQTRRDLSLLLDADITAGQIEQSIRSVIPAARLKGFDIFDVYTGASIPSGKKSIGLALTLQDDNQTLVDEEIQRIIADVVKILYDDLAIQLRD